MLSLILVSCGSSQEEEALSNGLVETQKVNFSMMSPENWRELGESELSKPRVWSVALALASSSQKENYINNLIVLEVENLLNESSVWLMENTKKWLETSLVTFKNLEEKTINFADNESGTLISYRGKYSNSTPELTYLQTARSCGENAYVLTVSLAEKLESYERYEYLLSTFKCE